MPDSPRPEATDPASGRIGDLNAFLPYLMNRVVNRMNQLLSERLRRHGLSFQEWRVLLVLSNTGPRSIQELSQATVVPHSTLSRLLVRMETDGLVDRRPAAPDGRVVEVSVTPAGRRLYQEIEPLGLDVFAEATQGFDAADYAAMRRLLRRIADNIGLF